MCQIKTLENISFLSINSGNISKEFVEECHFAAKDESSFIVDLRYDQRIRYEKTETRHEHLSKVCENNKKWLKRKSLYHKKNFIIDMEHKLTTCLMGKVGSSTWVEYFRILANSSQLNEDIENSGRIHGMINKFFSPNKVKYDLNKAEKLNKFNWENDHLTFVLVRNPYMRLISAFESKIIKTNDRFFILHNHLSSRAIILA